MGSLAADRPGRWGLLAAGAERLREPRVRGRARILVDLVVLYAAAGCALFADPQVHNGWSHALLAAVFPLFIVSMMNAHRGLDTSLKRSPVDHASQVLGAVSLAAMLAVAAGSSVNAPHPLAIPVRLWIFSVAYLGIARVVLLSLRSQLMRTQAFSIPTLVVGAGVVGKHLARRLTGEFGYGLRPVGYLDPDPLPTPLGPDQPLIPVLGGPGDLQEAIGATGARHVILAFSSEPDRELVATVRQCQELGVQVSLVPRLYQAVNERTSLDHVGGMPLLVLHAVDPHGWQFAVKHAFDRSVALLALLALSPVLALVALAVRLSSPGPILFRQRRVGRDGHEFDVLKFRTMRVPRLEAPAFRPLVGLAPGGIEGEDRRTPIGRLLRDSSLDELPQLFNVLRGDMSLVGPRPERPEFVRLFARDVADYEDRHRVKSGITGWAQVHGLRGQTSIADRVEWDNYYIQNWSLRLDARILVLTVAELLRFRG